MEYLGIPGITYYRVYESIDPRMGVPKQGGENLMAIYYAEEIQLDDLIWVQDCLARVTGLMIDDESNSVHIIARDLWSDGFILPSPFSLTNLIEVWNA